MPKVRGCRFWQNMVSSREKKRVDFTEKTVDLTGFHLQTLGICGALWSSITTWHGDIRDMIGLEGMAYRN